MAKKHSKIDINLSVIKAHKKAVKNAIDLAARTNTSLVIYENGKVKTVKPKYKYVRVASKPLPKRSRKKSA